MPAGRYRTHWRHRRPDRNGLMQIVPAPLPARLAALRNNPYFASLNDSVLRDVAQATQLRSYAAGEAICWQGEPCIGLYVLRQGRVKLFKLSPRGRELIVRVLEPQATFNEVPVFDNGLNPINVAALEACELWLVEASVIRHNLNAHPEMAQAVILNLAHNLRTLVGIVEELSFYQVTNRLARLIRQLPPGQRMTQDQMAARLGTVREVVARGLRELQRSGAIRVSRRQIEIVDEAILSEWIQSSDE